MDCCLFFFFYFNSELKLNGDSFTKYNCLVSWFGFFSPFLILMRSCFIELHSFLPHHECMLSGISILIWDF